ncbi:MAG: hypothetical protein A3E78_13785 [Alphaproteobacteria bacterium RIFCSPHIGHO2_12_FULL_63_12]|nr:MAG: hypothetical protein A3E78_13785 [Alphaproteobacteria bacterium RIFCSPHIGHO2_12_FULL_63_12]
MLIGDDTPAPTGEAAPHQENPSEAPATTPETPESDSWEARYENLRTDHGRLGNEVGSLRQKLAAQEQEIAESRRWREQQERSRRPTSHEQDAHINKFIADPNEWRDEPLRPLREEAKATRAEIDAIKQELRDRAFVAMVEEFRREYPKASKYADEINARFNNFPREHITKGLLEDAYMAAETRAGKKAEESAKEKLAALTRGAALPKGVASPNGNQPAGKAKTFAEAASRAKAKIEAGG